MGRIFARFEFCKRCKSLVFVGTVRCVLRRVSSFGKRDVVCSTRKANLFGDQIS